jgi:homocysteine S-methyltransferase
VETDLIFNRGIDLPGFASYPLLETEEGRETLRGYYARLIDMARQKGVGVLLESVTWVANRDRGSAIGYSPENLKDFNIAAIDLIAQVREEKGDFPTVLSAQMGPRGDGYAPTEQMTADEAEIYHAEQMETLSQTEADLVSAFTLCYPEEAVGIVRTGQRFDMPVAIAFTVETDGRLPTGMPLKEAIETVEDATDSGAAYFLINCAHPDHFTGVLTDEPWMQRLRGVVTNASRCSHAELDEAEELDDGDPDELGVLVGDLHKKFPHFTVIGGCCGTDMRHLRNIADQAQIWGMSVQGDLRERTGGMGPGSQRLDEKADVPVIPGVVRIGMGIGGLRPTQRRDQEGADGRMKPSPKLPLTEAERRTLRRAGIRLGEIAQIGAETLHEATGWEEERCRMIVALAQFQSLGSVGPSLARDLWDLGFRAVEDLKGANPKEMYEQFGEMAGQRADPCVEDVFRCAVAQAQDPDLPAEMRQWWMWKEERGKPGV